MNNLRLNEKTRVCGQNKDENELIRKIIYSVKFVK